jgi:hypothetical protein
MDDITDDEYSTNLTSCNTIDKLNQEKRNIIVKVVPTSKRMLKIVVVRYDGFST